MDLTPLFHPKTIAVIGVSLSNDRHPANVIYDKINLRYPVKVFPVNPKGGQIHRHPVFKDITDVPGPVDLAVIAARSVHVPAILKGCIEKKVGGATIISGGFAEVGRTDLQDKITSLAREAKLPFIGPNCLGIYAPDRFDTFFLPGQRLIRPEAGNVAVVSQSGGVLVDQMVKFKAQGIGLSIGVSIGNKALIREIDLLEYLAGDPATGVIAFYVEGFGPGEGRTFVKAAHQCPKPVIVLKAGKTVAGSRAASSHTASLAGDYAVFSQVMAQHCIAEAKSEYELLAFCEALSCYQETIDGRVGIITASGGHGVLAVDILSDLGLTTPTLSKSAQKDIYDRLTPSVQPIASVGNPVDLTGSAADEDFIGAAIGMSRSPEVESILLLILPYSPTLSPELGARLSQIYQEEKKPMVAYVPHENKYKMLIEGFELNNIPVSDSVEGAVLMTESLRRCQPC
ncbi:MAG: CoA-binding protein [Deltaproteobacteria bacterium]|nr:MAG: CoA-binding protein [Deltaproteobacteria bacterium]